MTVATGEDLDLFPDIAYDDEESGKLVVRCAHSPAGPLSKFNLHLTSPKPVRDFEGIKLEIEDL